MTGVGAGNHTIMRESGVSSRNIIDRPIGRPNPHQVERSRQFFYLPNRTGYAALEVLAGAFGLQGRGAARARDSLEQAARI